MKPCFEEAMAIPQHPPPKNRDLLRIRHLVKLSYLPETFASLRVFRYPELTIISEFLHCQINYSQISFGS